MIFLQTTKLSVTPAAEATRRRRAERAAAVIYCWSSRQFDREGERPPDDGWRAAGNERLYQAALSCSSRSRQARFLSNCIGFSNFLFQDEWIEILKEEEEEEGSLIVCDPGVIITYDPFSIWGFFPRRVLVITLSPNLRGCTEDSTR